MLSIDQAVTSRSNLSILELTIAFTMKRVRVFGCVVMLLVACQRAYTQEPNVVEDLKRELNAMREQMRVMEQQIQALQTIRATNMAVPSTNMVVQASSTNVAPTFSDESSSPMPSLNLISSDRGYLNISFDGLFAVGSSSASDVQALQPGGHDPRQRGFTVQNLETTFQGAVDPYFRALAAIIFQIDPEGESILEVEEAYAETTSLPWNLQLRAGQYFTEFGRHNQFHPHAWAFVDQPLVVGRFLGPDGLRSSGVRTSWLLPTAFYSELLFSVQNSQGETAFSFRNAHEDEVYLGRLHSADRIGSVFDLLLTPRWVSSFNLTPQQTVVFGTSAALGPNASGPESDTSIFGLDAFWKWKPASTRAGFPFVSFQSELMVRQYEAGEFSWDLNGSNALDPDERDLDGDGMVDVLPGERLRDWGVYGQALWGFRKGWVAGLRGDFVDRIERGEYERRFGLDEDRHQRWRVSPNLTWYPSEFSKVRLQYNLDRRQNMGVDHSVWLQFEFLLGAHSAHKF